jgi:hypothetical protein
MTAITDPGVIAHESNPDQFGQYLMRTYSDSHGVTRTIAWRPDIGSTYGPEHILFPVGLQVSPDAAGSGVRP